MTEEKIINFAEAKNNLLEKKFEESLNFDPLNRTGKYILVGKEAKPEPNLLRWGRWMEETSRIVKQQESRIGKRIWFVSTVFLGLNHRFVSDGVPILFETMIFNHTKGKRGKTSCDFMERYSTYEESEKEHEKVVKNLNVITACRRKLKKLKRKGLA